MCALQLETQNNFVLQRGPSSVLVSTALKNVSNNTLQKCLKSAHYNREHTINLYYDKNCYSARRFLLLNNNVVDKY